jgi:adenylate cyclase
LPVDEFSSMLSDWFRHVGTAIEEHKGNIEKIRGDSILAYWLANPGETSNTHITCALKTALDMVTASREFDDRMAAGYPGKEFRIGCGVHAGEAVLGNIGSDARRDYTALGDCVNITFRIESLCSTLQRSILVSHEIKTMVGEEFNFEDLGAHELKGKPQPIHIYSIQD